MANKRIGNYFFTDDGKIIKDKQEIIPINGSVKLDLSFGSVIADAAKLFVIARSTMLDLEVYQSLKVFFNDDDENNFSAGNIEYVFEPALQCLERKDFYVIPNFTSYAVNKNGDVVNRETGKMKKWNVTKGNEKRNITGGYFIQRSVRDDSKSTVLLRHRTLGIVFFPPSTNPRKLWINHINGIPGVDEHDNLEWVTPSENIKHSYRSGLTVKSLVPFLTRNIHTGEIKRYKSIIEYVEKIKCSFSGIHGRLAKSEIAFEDHQFKRDDGNEWPELKRISNGKPDEVRIACRNVFTGEQFVFDTIDAAGEFTGADRISISKHARERYTAPSSGWNFRLCLETESFPNHSAINLETYKVYSHKPPMPVVSEDGIVKFLGMKEFARYAGKSASQSSLYIRKQIPVHGKVFKRHRRDEGLGEPIKLLLR